MNYIYQSDLVVNLCKCFCVILWHLNKLLSVNCSIIQVYTHFAIFCFSFQRKIGRNNSVDIYYETLPIVIKILDHKICFNLESRPLV